MAAGNSEFFCVSLNHHRKKMNLDTDHKMKFTLHYWIFFAFSNYQLGALITKNGFYPVWVADKVEKMSWDINHKEMVSPQNVFIYASLNDQNIDHMGSSMNY